MSKEDIGFVATLLATTVLVSGFIVSIGLAVRLVGPC